MASFTGNDVKKFLVENGYNRKDFSITVRQGGYDDYIRVQIKNIDVSKNAIENLIKKNYQEIRYDERTLEILQGCNVFVDVDYSRDALKEYQEQQDELAQSILDSVPDDNLGHVIFKNDNYTWYYYPESNSVSIFEKDERTTRNSYPCHNSNDLTYLMASLNEYIGEPVLERKSIDEEIEENEKAEELKMKQDDVVISDSFIKSVEMNLNQRFHYMITDRLSQKLDYQLRMNYDIDELQDTYVHLYYCLKSFDDDMLPEWLTTNELNKLETRILSKADMEDFKTWRKLAIKKLKSKT